MDLVLKYSYYQRAYGKTKYVSIESVIHRDVIFDDFYTINLFKIRLQLALDHSIL